MSKILLNIVAVFGRVLGSFIALLYFKKLSFLFYICKRSCITGFYRRRFKHFGSRSFLASGITLAGAERVTIGEDTSIMSYVVLETWGDAAELSIGDFVSIGEFSHITCSGKVVIGNGVLTGRYVLITDNNHGRCTPEEMDTPPIRRELHSPGPVVIGNNVWIGDKVTILPNVTIGDGAVIGANTLVSKDVPPYAVVGGIPAKVIRTIK